MTILDIVPHIVYTLPFFVLLFYFGKSTFSDLCHDLAYRNTPNYVPQLTWEKIFRTIVLPIIPVVNVVTCFFIYESEIERFTLKLSSFLSSGVIKSGKNK